MKSIVIWEDNVRTLRKDSENLRDVRIAYTLLLSLALICVILGIVSERLGLKLKRNELDDCYRSLAVCSDTLADFELEDTLEDKYSAALRFENALATLPGKVELAPLAGLAELMKQNAADAATVRTYAETFSLLGALEYNSGKEAEETAAAALRAVGEVLGPGGDAGAADLTDVRLPAEVLGYSKENAQKGIYAVFGKGAGTLEAALSEDGRGWYVEADNLRMTFSAENGSLEGFIYLRIGSGSTVGKGERMSDEERMASAMELLDSTVRYSGKAEAEKAGEACGFLVTEISVKDSLYRATVDEAGRVWSLMKVKR